MLNTLRLQDQGLLRSYPSPHADDYPPAFRSPDGAWYGFAARARVLLVNTDRLGADPPPQSVTDLTDPRWKGQVGIAKPLFGTTSTHAACLYAVWGQQRAEHFFRQVHQNAQILPGNRQVAQAVASGHLLFGLTDTDDAVIELERGQPVRIIYPDQQPGAEGTLFLPNSLALLKGSPHQANAERLLDFLLAPRSEQQLARGPSAQIPLNRQVFPSFTCRNAPDDPPDAGRFCRGGPAVGPGGAILAGPVCRDTMSYGTRRFTRAGTNRGSIAIRDFPGQQTEFGRPIREGPWIASRTSPDDLGSRNGFRRTARDGVDLRLSGGLQGVRM